MFDYESPIELITNELAEQVDDYTYKTVPSYAINVDKEELLKALRYDRGQYDKGYTAGRLSALEEIVRCKDCKWRNTNGCIYMLVPAAKVLTMIFAAMENGVKTMREHIGLFRGKRIDNGEWVEGYYIPALEEGRHCIYPQTSPDMGCYVDPDTIGECTGLKDKNGELIFEGDIVEGGDFDAEDGYGVVSWYDAAFEVGTEFFCGTFHENYFGKEFEIIGNIHDNPELLKGGEGE